MELRRRAATIDDLDAIVRVYAEMADVDHPWYAASRDEVLDELEVSWVDLTTDTRIVFDRDRAVAFGQIYCPGSGETMIRAHLFGGVVPAYRGRGIGRELLGWQLGRARERLTAIESSLPRRIQADAVDGSSAIPLLERMGLHATRWFAEMERDGAMPVAEAPAPPGLRMVRFTRDRGAEALATKNTAFRDHWGAQPTPAEQWERILDAPSFRADLSFLAVDEADRIVGLLTTLVIPEDWERQGYSSAYIQIIATLREWRRRGVASALIAATLGAIAAAGIERAQLTVDAANPTGAFGLYESHGFRATERSQAHVMDLA